MDEEEENFLEISNKIGQTIAKLLTLNKLVQRKVPDDWPEDWTSAIPGIVSKRIGADKVDIMIEDVAKRISTKLLNIGDDGKLRIELSRYETRNIEGITKEEFQSIVEKSQQWQEEVERDLASPIDKYWCHEATAEKMTLLTKRGYLLPFSIQVCRYYATLPTSPMQVEKAVRHVMDSREISSMSARNRLEKTIKTAQEKIHRLEGTHEWTTCRPCQSIVAATGILAEAQIITHSFHMTEKERYVKLTAALTRMLQIVTIPRLVEQSNETMLYRALKQNGGVQFVGEEHLPTMILPQLKEAAGNLSIAYMMEFLMKTIMTAATWKWSDVGTLRAMKKALPQRWRDELDHINSAKHLIEYLAKKYIIKPLNMVHVEAEFETLGFPKAPILTMDMSSGLITRAEYLALIISLKTPDDRRIFQEKMVRDMIFSKYPNSVMQNLKSHVEKTGTCNYNRMREFLTGPENTKKTLTEQRSLYWTHQIPQIRYPGETLKRKMIRIQPRVEIKRIRLAPEMWDIKERNNNEDPEPMDIAPLVQDEITDPPVMEMIPPFGEPHLIISEQEMKENKQGEHIKIGEIVHNKLRLLGTQWSEEKIRIELAYQMQKHNLTLVQDNSTGENPQGEGVSGE